MYYQYKHIEQNDLPFIERLFKHKAYKDIFFEDKTTLKDWTNRFEQIKSFQIIYNHKEPFGVLDLKVSDDIVEISLLCITYPARNLGYGSNILRDIKSSYPNKRIKVSVMKTNKEAYQFYVNKGFVPLKEYEEFYEEQNRHHLYIELEQLKVQLYQDLYYQDFLKLQVEEFDQTFVSSPENILYKHIKDKEHTKLYIAKLKNQLVGTILLRFDQECVFIWQLLISKEYQNQKIGTALLKSIINDIKKNYKDIKITTTVINENTRSKLFFKKNGFIIHSIEENEPETNYIYKM